MNQTRIDQMVAALEWAKFHNTRSADVKVDLYSNDVRIYVSHFVGSDCIGVIVEPDTGCDIDALLTAKEKQNDEKELARLQKKLAKEA